MPRATVSIGSYDLPEPTTYKSTTSTLVDSGRNVQGVLLASEVRTLAKIELSYSFISASDLSNLLKKFNKNYGGGFAQEVTYLDMDANEWLTKQMYISDRSASLISRNPKTGNVDGYKEVKFSLVEV